MKLSIGKAMFPVFLIDIVQMFFDQLASKQIGDSVSRAKAKMQRLLRF